MLGDAGQVEGGEAPGAGQGLGHLRGIQSHSRSEVALTLPALLDELADALSRCAHDEASWQEGFKISKDPLFVEKVYDVVGLYVNPPEAAVVLCVDEKSQVQALARSQPAFPMMPGMPEKRTHDYVRHGTTSLFAAFNTADGTVISSLHRRHRAIEFKKFLTKIDNQIPGQLDVHLVCDNYGTHKHPRVKRWLENHPRFTMHFTPTYSSWINQVERFFAYVTADLLQRSDHRSVQALEADIRAWVKAWNENPQPFIWTKTAEQILGSLQRLLQRTTGAGH
jgi:transposase